MFVLFYIVENYIALLFAINMGDFIGFGNFAVFFEINLAVFGGFNFNIIDTVTEIALYADLLPLVGEAGLDFKTVEICLNTHNVLGDRYVHPGGGARKPADIGKTEVKGFGTHNV